MLDTATPATLLTALVLVSACTTAVEAKSFRNVFTDEDRFMLVPVHNEDTLTSWVRTCRMQKKLNIMNICFQLIVGNKFAIFSPQNLFPRVGRSGGGVLGVPRLGQGQLLNRYSEAGTFTVTTLYLQNVTE